MLVAVELPVHHDDVAVRVRDEVDVVGADHDVDGLSRREVGWPRQRPEL